MVKKYLSVGDKFGRLTVLRYSHRVKHSFADSRRNFYSYYYECKCDCGKTGKFKEDALKSGNTKSCGCLNHDMLVKRNTTHNLSHTKLYKIYHGIKKRCYNPKDSHYEYYGGKGIIMCKEWLADFRNFYDWAINNGYKESLSIERLDIYGNYTPENCTWIPRCAQSRNTSRNVFYEYKGKRKILPDWAREYGLPFTCVRKRLVRGWSLERALNTPNLRKKERGSLKTPPPMEIKLCV